MKNTLSTRLHVARPQFLFFLSRIPVFYFRTACLGLLLTALPGFVFSATIRVKFDAPGANDGTTWNDAFVNLQDAIDAATAGDEIWVAAGTYKPTKDPFGSSSPTDPRDKTFYLKNGVKIYGGFDGGETMLSERDWAANVTILSGDLNGDDVGFTNNTENAYHVLTSVLDNSTTELDGFTVTGGNGNGTDNLLIEGLPTYRGIGGGMENRNSSPTVSNCIFTGNAADGGGAMYNIVNASPALTNCVFSGNSSTGGGGAMFNNDNCNPTLTNCVFSGNSSNNSGGALWNQTSSSPMLTNCVFSGNKAAIDGGAVLNISSSAPVLKNCIIWNNRRASTTGSASGSIFNISSTPVISYSLIQNQNPSGTGNLNGTTNAANSNYPAFITPLDPITAPSTGGNFSLTACSPVIDLGDATGAPTTDISGNARVDAIFGGGIYDLGAYEYQSDTDADDDGYQACTGFDCNDNDASINPGATETVDDGIDQNCNGGDLCYKDADNDGYRPDAVSTVNSADLDCNDSGEAIGTDPTTDCDDNCAACFPGATEICDNKDNDCDTNIPTQEVPGSVWYVDIDATTDGNGASWACASQDLQDAINAASSGHQIWVAAGTYKPTREPDGTTDATRDFTFLLKDGVKIYGGFDGSETMLSERDWVANVTTLSGDLNGNDVGFTNNGENVHHVVVSVGDGSATELDGFTITGGNANGAGNITISPVTVARFQCGGFYNTGSSPSVSNCTISGNAASSNGGGVFNSSSTSSFTNCTFSGNTAGAGGGMFNQISSDVTLTNCVFAGNTSTGTGGGTGGGGIYITGNSASVLTSCLFSGNTSATTGGGIFVTGSVPTLTNCTISGNRATTNGGGMRNESSANAILTNCLIWNNRANSVTGTASSSISNSSSTPVITYSLVQAQTPSGTGNLDGITNAATSNYPAFTTPLSPTSAPSTAGNFQLTACSPVIDLGDATGAPTTDILGNARVDAIFGGGTYDLGAYEYQSDTDADDDGYQACTGFDCNDNDAAIYPGATETVNDGIDQNCDGGDLCYKDADNDGYRPDAVSTVNSADLDCTDSGEAVSSDPTTDCDDTNANSYPGATEICDNKDNDCDTNIPTQEVPGSVWYVDIDATTDGNGASWACASQDLQQPITDAATGHEVWAAAGTYKPTTDPFGNASPTDPRDKTFYLKAFVKVYGGFTGTETMLSERDWKTNVTTLSGDLGTANVNTDNSYHVVLSVSDGVGTELNGFTIEKGNATGGGSITVESSSIARNAGGGLYCGLSNLALNNCIISGNSATFGGGLYSISTNPTVSNCFFYNNTADTGGGVRNNGSSPVMSNCVFSGNSASTVGGGMANAVSSNPALTNCTFSGNNAGPSGGGGIYNSNASNPILKNCIIWNNRAATVTGSASSSILNSSSTPVISYSLVQNQNPSGTGNLNGTTNAATANYPSFTTPLDPATAPSTAGNFSLTVCSPVLDLGTDTGAPTSDISGNARVDAIFGGGIYDLGAYEYQSDADVDNDGYQACTGFDCNDADAGINPGATEIVDDGIDQNCDGVELCFKDTDNDGYRPDAVSTVNSADLDCTDSGEAVSTDPTTDCDDADAMRFPGNPEICDNKDNDCDLSIPAGEVPGSVWYVNASASAGGNGASWGCAFQNLQDAIDAASSGHEIWVKSGTYLPTKDPSGNASPTDPRDKAFYLKDGVKIYGGFDGTETMLSERDWATNVTTLSGDIGTAGVNTDNCYHVVLSISDANTTIFDGFRVIDGYADGANSITVEGQSIYRYDCGGMTNKSSSPTIANCIFSGNTTTTKYGGGLFNVISSNPTITNCVFSGNYAKDGGGMCNYSSSATLTNCTFSGNTATTAGGGIFCIFSSTVTLKNSVIWNNRVGTTTGSANSALQLQGGGSATISYSLVQAQNPSGTGNLNGTTNAANSNYPGFTTLLDPTNAPSTAGNFQLALCSPLLDLGTDSGAPTTDILGNARVDAIFGGGIYDIGAYEYQSDADVDDDGYQACTGFDCNDNDAAIYPGATEIAGDEIDQNCDGSELCYMDTDNDGYRTSILTISLDTDCSDSGEALATDPATDCDDTNMSINPAATDDVCNAIDEDCSGTAAPDQTAPSITCPSNTTVAANGGCAGVVGVHAATSATDNCGAPSVAQSPLSNTPLSGHDDFETVVLTATDGAGNTATCSFTVTLKDATAPSIACPADATVAADGSCAGTVGIRTAASSGDNCGTPTVTQSPASGTVLSGHDDMETVVLTATDGAGNTATCSFTVTLKDNTAPSITCPADATVAADGSCAGTVGIRTAASSGDNCGAPTVTQSPASGTVLSGHDDFETVVLTATDGAGNIATCSFTVTLKDNTAPSITCPANTTVAADGSCAGTVGVRTAASSGDNCGAPTVAQSPASNTILSGHDDFETVVLTATDGAGNTETCSFTVTLKDATAPSITCPSDQTVSADINGDYALADFRGSATSSDNCGSPGEAQSPVATTTLGIGGHTVSITATDGVGLTATCSFALTVEAACLPPTLACPSNTTVSAGGSCQGVLADYRGSATLTDGCGSPALTQSPASGTVLSGHDDMETVVLTVTDGNGSTATCSFTVTIQDVTPPGLTCPGPVTVGTSGGVCGGTATWAVPVPTDNCGGASIQSASHLPGATFGGGTTTVTYVAVDAVGNTASCAFGVTVLDDDPPTAACKAASVTLNASGTAVLAASAVNDGSSDNCTASGSLSLSVSPNLFGCAEVGPNTVTLTVADGAGHSGQCTAVVTVVDALYFSQTSAPVATDGLAGDRLGHGVGLWGGVLVAGAPDDKVGTQAKQGSAYVFLQNEGGSDNWGQLKQVKASDGAAVDYFGNAVSVDGSLALVGAHGDNVGAATDAGSAYIYEKDHLGTDNWGQRAKFGAVIGGTAEPAAYDYYGNAVSLRGGRAVVGAAKKQVGANAAQGAVYVHEKDAGGPNNWGHVKKLVASDGGANNFFGQSVSQWGDVVLVGASGNLSNRGAAYLFGKDTGGAGNWGQAQKLTANDAAVGDGFGASVSLTSGWAVIGAPNKSTYAGAAYIFKNNAGTWSQAKKLTASDGAPGDRFGTSVWLEGDHAYVSAVQAGGAGAVYVFHRDAGGAGNWGEVGKYQPVGGSPGERFGHALSASGDRLALGAPLSDVSGRVDQGRAYVLDGEDCGGLPRLQTGGQQAALSLAAAAPAVRCWPSPFSDALTVELGISGPAAEVRVTDAAGRVVLRAALPAGQARLELGTAALRPGMYFVLVATAEGTNTVPVALVR